MTHTLPRRLERTPRQPEHAPRRATSCWNCMPCFDLDSSIAELRATGRGAFRPTESQAMCYALALAEEYVRAAEHYPIAPSPEPATPSTAHSRLPLLPGEAAAAESGSSDCDFRVQSRPLLLMDGLGLSTHAAGAMPAPPVHSTRSRRDRPRTASGSSDASTLCGGAPAVVDGHPDKRPAAGLRWSIKHHGRRLLAMVV
ncbi:hypothetical protein IWQ56_000832 [Coemansia nantahalensis]|nr:hypothetical protein IWQ56_000832 [Coemansia nantahalensis]